MHGWQPAGGRKALGGIVLKVGLETDPGGGWQGGEDWRKDHGKQRTAGGICSVWGRVSSIGTWWALGGAGGQAAWGQTVGGAGVSSP